MSTELSSRWKTDLSQAFRSVDQLIAALQLTSDQLPEVDDKAEFRLLVPQSFAQRMRPGEPLDPLLRQVLPLKSEHIAVEGFTTDAVGDTHFRNHPGLIQKYHGRVLLMLSGACAINCRYCFRRHYPYHEEPRSLEQWEPAISAIAADSSITEVIFSGGDPLVQATRRLRELTDRLSEIDHLKRLRIHTRLPIVLPSRVDDELLDWLESIPMTPVMVLHSNHPHELQADCAEAIERLAGLRLHLLNQSVLLAGINDNEQSMLALCERLVELGVLPYYTHQLDRVTGTAHFEVPMIRGLEIHQFLRTRLPGYAVPTYVQEQEGETSKTVLS